MRPFLSKFNPFILGIFLIASTSMAQEFQGKAYYFSKSTLELGSFGARLSEAQKKQVKDNLKNRLEKTYVLTFDKEASTFKEEDKLDAISGATDSWGNNFSPGLQYKNVKNKSLAQSQDFYGKLFLVNDQLPNFKWTMGTETKQIGNYTSFKATSKIPAKELTWYDFSWDEIRSSEENVNKEEIFIDVEAWYTPQVPVSHGPSEFWGLPGLILEVRVGKTVMLCSEIVMNPKEKVKIEAPDKGKIVTKMEYKNIITGKMREMRDNRGRRNSGF